MSKSAISWLLFVAGGLLGAGITAAGPRPSPAWFRALTCGYLAWSLFWGAPPAWRQRHAIRHRLERWLTFEDHTLRWSVGISILLSWIWLYSCLGGGLYQFLQYQRAGRGPAPRRPLASLLSPKRWRWR